MSNTGPRSASDARGAGDVRAFVDSTGAGEPIYEALRREDCFVRPYPFTAKSKAELVDNLSLMLEKAQITLPRPALCPELIDELEGFQYSVSEAGNVKSSAPGGMHDDCVVALGLAAMCAGPVRRESRIWRL